MEMWSHFHDSIEIYRPHCTSRGTMQNESTLQLRTEQNSALRGSAYAPTTKTSKGMHSMAKASVALRACFISSGGRSLFRLSLRGSRQHVLSVNEHRHCSHCLTPRVRLRPQGALSGVAATSLTDLLFGPLWSALNASSPALIRYLVWDNFRVAVLFFVFAPLTLFLWSFSASCSANDAVRRVLAGYWQASSLLLLTVLLDAGGVSWGASTGLFVQIMIATSLHWWKDLNAEIEEDISALAKAFRTWRAIATACAIAGVAVQIPFQKCNFVANVLGDKLCAPWMEPPTRFWEIVTSAAHTPDTHAAVLFAQIGVGVYFGYLMYFVGVVLPKVGRNGRADRNCFSSVALMKWLRLLDADSRGN